MSQDSSAVCTAAPSERPGGGQVPDVRPLLVDIPPTSLPGLPVSNAPHGGHGRRGRRHPQDCFRGACESCLAEPLPAHSRPLDHVRLPGPGLWPPRGRGARLVVHRRSRTGHRADGRRRRVASRPDRRGGRPRQLEPVVVLPWTAQRALGNEYVSTRNGPPAAPRSSNLPTAPTATAPCCLRNSLTDPRRYGWVARFASTDAATTPCSASATPSSTTTSWSTGPRPGRLSLRIPQLLGNGGGHRSRRALDS